MSRELSPVRPTGVPDALPTPERRLSDTKPRGRVGRPTRRGRAGRPRSEDADRAILRATVAMLDEGLSVDALSIEAVAARAGVGKATVYRRWSNKYVLIAAAVAALHEPQAAVAGSSVRHDLIAVLRDLLQWARDSPSARVLPHLVSGMRAAPIIGEHYSRFILEPRRALLRAVLRRGVQTREIDGDLDVELTLSLLLGMVVTRLVLNTNDAELDRLPERIVDLVLFGAASAA